MRRNPYGGPAGVVGADERRQGLLVFPRRRDVAGVGVGEAAGLEPDRVGQLQVWRRRRLGQDLVPAAEAQQAGDRREHVEIALRHDLGQADRVDRLDQPAGGVERGLAAPLHLGRGPQEVYVVAVIAGRIIALGLA